MWRLYHVFAVLGLLAHAVLGEAQSFPNTLKLLYQATDPSVVESVTAFQDSIYTVSSEAAGSSSQLVYVTKYDHTLHQLLQTKTIIPKPNVYVVSVAIMQNNHNLQQWSGYVVTSYSTSNIPLVLQFDPETLAWTGNRTLPMAANSYWLVPYWAQATSQMLFASTQGTGFLQCGLFESLGTCMQVSWNAVAGIHGVQAFTVNQDVHHPTLYALTNCSTGTEACYLLALDLKTTRVIKEYIFNYTFAYQPNNQLPFMGYTQDQNGNTRLYWAQNGFNAGIYFVAYDPYAYEGAGGVGGFSMDQLLDESVSYLSATGNALQSAWVAYVEPGENQEAFVVRLNGLTRARGGLLTLNAAQLPYAIGQNAPTLPVTIPNTNMAVVALGSAVYIYG